MQIDSQMPVPPSSVKYELRASKAFPAHPLDPLSADEVRMRVSDHISVPIMAQTEFRSLQYPYPCATTLLCTPPSKL